MVFPKTSRLMSFYKTSHKWGGIDGQQLFSVNSRSTRANQAIKQANMSYADQEVVLMSKDNTEYKVKFGIAMASETIKALSSFPEEEEDQDDCTRYVLH